ncbi:PfkB family carbohydrate kinase, partial [Mesorhizobium sp. M7A.F.Ca.CA.001.08.1.1]|uniref:PfkB family carbohydrate kinase n=1 Tax=Mesorhizobium sp. M7A.F.Ca.CA.001.08.1.1 TaxID=2496691 RepID=UPI000FCB8BF4
TVARAIAGAGITDLSAVFLDRTTPSYTALIDSEGELIVGFADMALYDLAFPKQIRRSRVREVIAAADAVFCDANLPTTALERLVALAAGKPVFAIAISPAKVVRLLPVLKELSLVFMNRREAMALAGVAANATEREVVDGLRCSGLVSGVVTAGGGPMLGFDEAGAFSILPPPPRKVADVTGAGDALAGATVAALLRGLPLRAALREGIAGATLAIESAAAVPEFTAASFAEALVLVPDAREVA